MSRFTDIDLAKLPAADVIETLDYEALVTALKTKLVTLGAEIGLDLSGVMALESEPLVKLMENFAYHEMILRGRVNDAAKAVMPAYAIGTDLDHLAARNGVVRLVLEPADNTTTPPTPAVMEDDERLRARMQLALEAFTTAGSYGAYLFHVLAIAGVLDCEAYGPESGLVQPAEVLLVILARDNGGTADAALLETVRQNITADEKRPLSDHVMIESAEIITYDVVIDVEVLPGPDMALVKNQLEAAVQAYVENQFRVGRAIRRVGLGGIGYIEGVHNDIQVSSPAADVVPTLRQAARCNSIAVNVTQIPGRWFNG
ncbi:MAG: baseplate J/gp47 family protein [Pseudomonadota bacterium]